MQMCTVIEFRLRSVKISFDYNLTDFEVTDLGDENPGDIGDIFTTYVNAIMCVVL